jgi:hypothetical protein
LAILAALRDCFRGRASLEVLASTPPTQFSRTLGEATEADRIGSVLLGVFGSHWAVLAVSLVVVKPETGIAGTERVSASSGGGNPVMVVAVAPA